jgi:hypothetical protein
MAFPGGAQIAVIRHGPNVPLPVMQLDFLNNTSLNSRITFSRGTGATRVNASGFIEVVGNTTPRFDYDPVTLAPRGLLIEEARTNLALYSQDFSNASWAKSSATVTSDTTAAPDGTTTADTLVSSSSTSGVVERSVTFTGDGDKAVSIFLKAGTSTLTYFFIRDTTVPATRGRAVITWAGGVPSATADSGGTIQGVDNFGNGWYRIRLLASSVVAANSNAFRIQPDVAVGTNSVIAWGAQAENGAFATSYIPTVASTVSRSADVATMTGTNFSTWYNQSEGTFVAEAQSTISLINQNSVYSASDNTQNNRIVSTISPESHGAVVTGGVLQANLDAGTPTAGSITKIAFATRVNDFAVSLNGGTIVTDTSGTMPTVSRLILGANGEGSAAFLNGHLRAIAYYNTRLPNTQLQTLTAPSLASPLALDFISPTYTVGY